jgi:uncharacterized protein (TIGR03790 family)
LPLSCRRGTAALLLALVAAVAPAAPSAPPSSGITADQVAVIVNDNDPTSREIAAYYAQRRRIPAAHLCHLRTTSAEEIDHETYATQIEAPVGAWLKSHGLTERILVLVTTTGVPLKVAGSISVTGTAASVDSELTLLYPLLHGQPPHRLEGGIPNPFFGSTAHFRHPAFPIYLVTRLTAFTVGDVRLMIDHALEARNRGVVVLDGKDNELDDGALWLKAAANRLPRDRVILDESERLVENVSDVIAYAGWGSNDPHRHTRYPGMHWLPGAIAVEFVSTDARTFHEPPREWTIGGWKQRLGFYAGSPQSLSADLLREGATGVSGHVYEPYLQYTPHPDQIFPVYLEGWTLAESYWRGIPLLSWMNVVVGDPLCRLEGR